jgi:enterochelin esterase family protein
MILVMPDATTRFGGSQYINSPATGRYQDYLLELVGWVDNEFRTTARRESRAVAGKSSGGFGALRLVMDQPQVFGLAADHCGDKYFETCYFPTLPRTHRAAASMPDLPAVLADPRSHMPKDQAFKDVMEAAALSACYSPNAHSPFGFDFPFHLPTGAVRPEVWARWREHDPLVRLDDAADALRSLRLLFLDCGRNDEFYLNVGMRLFHDRLESLGIDHTYLEHDGGHFDIRHRYAISLEAISQAID